VLGDAAGEPVGDEVERRVPARALALRVAHGAHLRVARASRLRLVRHGQVQRRALGAELSAARRMVGIAAHRDDALSVALHPHTATRAAVAADGSGDRHGFSSTTPSTTRTS
jgi:hypothetical protein